MSGGAARPFPEIKTSHQGQDRNALGALSVARPVQHTRSIVSWSRCITPETTGQPSCSMFSTHSLILPGMFFLTFFIPHYLVTRPFDFASIIRPYGRSFRSEEHTSELQSLMRISYAVFC